MQVSPYRVLLAGIRTSPVEYQPLARSYRAAGLVSRNGDALSVPLEIPARHASWLKECQHVQVRCRDAADTRPVRGRLRLADRPSGKAEDDVQATVVIEDTEGRLRPGMLADVVCEVPACRLEPFRSLPTSPPALRAGEPRKIYSCPEHPRALRAAPGRCSVEGNPLMATALAENQRVGWWCPMHPAVTSNQPGQQCGECGGMALEPRVVTFQPPGKVLAVPASAVIDTGSRTYVFVETMPGMFDGVEIELGPRCGGDYPVASGLEPGQRVAVAGAFLLDAETRLNPSLASGYFGAGARTESPVPAATAAVTVTASKPALRSSTDPSDQQLASRQKICPVTRKALGSMGTPIRVVAAGRVVFLCCDGCKDTFMANPGRYLAAIPQTPAP